MSTHILISNLMITRKNCFRYLKLMSPLNVAICTTISYTLWVEWYYLKNNYLTLRSKVKVQRRSLRYATHHLMVMHPHTIYHWPISKDKKVMVQTSFAEKKRKIYRFLFNFNKLIFININFTKLFCLILRLIILYKFLPKKLNISIFFPQ